MDAPIGVFDSGLGGLTVVKAIKKLLPNEQIIYFGDTAHLPYGEKSPEIIRNYVQKIILFLKNNNVKAIVVACNTVSAIAIDLVYSLCQDLLVFEVITPTVNYAVRHSKFGHICVIGTTATINSHTYLIKILERRPGAYVIEKATKLLVPLIEEGWVTHAISKKVIEAYLSEINFDKIDSLILGCTHYPLIENEIASYFDKIKKKNVHIINSSDATALHLYTTLRTKSLLKQIISVNNSDLFYVSDITDQFQKSANLFFQQPINLQKVTL